MQPRSAPVNFGLFGGRPANGTPSPSNYDYFTSSPDVTPTPVNSNPADYAALMRGILRGRIGRNRDLLTGTVGQLGTQRTDYRNSANDILDQENNALTSSRNNYATRAQALLDQDRAASDSEYSDFAKSGRAAADLAISSGDRANKAMFAQKGIGAGGYSSRLATGLRLKANTDLSQKLAGLKRENRLRTLDSQRSLDSGLFGTEHGDTANLFAGRSRLTDQLAGMDRGDIQFNYGAQSAQNNSEAQDAESLERELYDRSSPDPFRLRRRLNPYGSSVASSYYY